MDILWEVLPIAVFVLFTFLYCIWKIKIKIKIDYIRYIFFVLYPYIYKNPSYTQEYVNLLYLLSILIILEFICEIFLKKFTVTPVFVLYSIFLIYIIISGILIYPDTTLYIGIRNIVFFSLTTFSLYYKKGECMNDLCMISKVNLIIMMICGVSQVLIQNPAGLRHVYSSYRISAFTANANTYGYFIILYLFFSITGETLKKDLIFFGVATIAVILSGSISATLSLIFLIAVSMKKPKYITKRFCDIFIAVIFVLMLYLIFVRVLNPVKYNIMFPSQPDRMSLWALFLNAFTERPLFGHGWYTLPFRIQRFLYNMPNNYYTDNIYNFVKNGETVAPHNDLIKLLAETGIIGTSLCLILLLCIYKRCHKCNQEKFLGFFCVGIIFFLTHNIMQEYEFWLIFFAVVLLDSKKTTNKLD